MEAAVSTGIVHRPSYGTWLLSNFLGIIIGLLASVPPALLYWVMVDAYIDNSGGDALVFGTAFICGSLSLITTFAGWLVYAAVIHSRMSEWTNANLVRTVVGIQGLALSLLSVNGFLSLLISLLAFLLLPLVFMQIGDRDPGRTPVIVIGVVLAVLAVIVPIIALSSEIRPF